MTDRLPSSELSEVATSETYKPVEVEFSEIQSIGQTEKAMVARIDQDGDPDLVFQDLVEMETKVVNPASKEFTSDAIPAGEESGQCQQGGAEIETKCPVTWKEIFQTKTGKEFQNAMMGIGPDGKQDVIKGRINRDYSMREFVRRHPREALQYMEIFQREYGVPHYDLQKAIQQVAELEQNPFQVSQEDPKYAELSDRMEQDARYIELRNQLYNDHKVKVFGTTDFRDIPLERFIDLVSLDSNILYSVDAEAEKVFRETYPDVARLYDERESKRVYRDPDGLINIDRDPLFLKMLEPNSHGEVWTREEAMRRFALMYPDKAKFYAERYTELRPYLENQTEFAGKNLAETFVTTQNVVGDNLAQAENFNLEVVAINTLAQSVLERLQEAGVEARIIQIVNAGEFTEAVILPKKEIFTEKMVRVYRGVNQLDASLLKQVPYAMRAEGENETGSVVLDNLTQEVAILANEPTYENLIKYVNKAKSQMNEIQRTKLDRDLAEIESGILKGNSVRTELIYHQIGHNGGFFDSGISPYLSVSWSPSEALEYAGLNGAILVIDVPISQIEDFGDNCTETNLKGVLDPNNITAIIPINGVNK
ncbi:MAG: hypothetical protein NZM26_02910, partial [Patescibacteria group bacterium]|nr:hypothetical protein [Patescibacteria group bacterium]